MKHEKWLSCLMGAVLSFAAAVAGVGCVETAFGFEQLIWLPGVLLPLALWSVAVSVLLALSHGGKWLAALSVLTVGILLYQEEVLLQLESLLNKLSLTYNAAYRWGMISWSGQVKPDTPVTWAMILLGGLVEIGVSFSVCRRKWLAVGLVSGLLPLFACCVVTDSVPAEGYLYLLLLTQMLVILPHLAGRIHTANGIRLTAMLLVPVLLGMLLLFSVVSPEKHDEQSAKLRQTLTEMMQKLPFVVPAPGGDSGITVGNLVMDRVDLWDVGPSGRQTYAVMDVVSPVTKTLYLRGQALDVYDGISWSLGPGANQEDPYWPSDRLLYWGPLVISTRSILPLKYLPYYTNEAWAQQENGLTLQQHNSEQETQYQVRLYESALGGATSSASGFTEDVQAYLSLPESTRQWAVKILQQLFADEKTMAEQAETVRAYVSNSAKYDLNTPKMPFGETDFALWFLEESETGYCTHFASAAAVLLRAAGIPARYVTGYTVNAMTGRRVTVTAEQAHAWVEYLDEDLVWKVLEATPADPQNSQPRPQITTPTDPTEQTTAPTQESTKPTESVGTKPTLETTSSTESTTEPVNQTTLATGNSTLPTGGETGEGKPDLTVLWSVVNVIAWICGAILVLAVQYLLRLRHRRKGMYTGDRNRQAIRRWHYAMLVGKRMRCTVPERLDDLAEKAAYSQHTLTVQELSEFDAWLEERHQELSRWPLLPKIFVKLVFALE